MSRSPPPSERVMHRSLRPPDSLKRRSEGHGSPRAHKDEEKAGGEAAICPYSLGERGTLVCRQSHRGLVVGVVQGGLDDLLDDRSRPASSNMSSNEDDQWTTSGRPVDDDYARARTRARTRSAAVALLLPVTHLALLVSSSSALPMRGWQHFTKLAPHPRTERG